MVLSRSLHASILIAVFIQHLYDNIIIPKLFIIGKTNNFLLVSSFHRVTATMDMRPIQYY